MKKLTSSDLMEILKLISNTSNLVVQTISLVQRMTGNEEGHTQKKIGFKVEK